EVNKAHRAVRRHIRVCAAVGGGAIYPIQETRRGPALRAGSLLHRGYGYSDQQARSRDANEFAIVPHLKLLRNKRHLPIGDPPHPTIVYPNPVPATPRLGRFLASG